MTTGFGVENLPYGVARLLSGATRPVVRIEDGVIDLHELARRGLLEEPAETFAGPTLDPFLARGRDVWASTRTRLIELAGGSPLDRARLDPLPIAAVELVLPIGVGDYVDFYASLEHATNLGRLFRPDAEPLLPNWRHLPVGYHGRSGTVVVSGTPIRRPYGQRSPERPGEPPTYGPERRLDVELELGFVTGAGPPQGTPVTVADAADHIFGFVLVNDWSARELQRWEYQPLGPFLGKSFATSIGAWIVPLAAVEPLRVAGPVQEPAPLDYLRCDEPWALDVELEIALTPRGGAEAVVSRTNARGLYWNPAQQLAHATANGARFRAGDLFASGTISGAEPGTHGSLVELTWGGRDPLDVGGVERRFLEDGDTVMLRGIGGAAPISFGEVAGTIVS